jgi:hypothetical protein
MMRVHPGTRRSGRQGHAVNLLVPPLSASSPGLAGCPMLNYWPPPLPQSRKSTWTRYDAAGTTGAAK